LTLFLRDGILAAQLIGVRSSTSSNGTTAVGPL
jgi:hypothetical protein